MSNIELNQAQQQAVEAPDGPVLILAGAGSGKTKALTHRIAHVIDIRELEPREICAVTFTNKAAREMRVRVEQLLGGSTGGMWLGTFHSLGARMLRRDGEAIEIAPNFTIYDEVDRQASVKRAMQLAGINTKQVPVTRVTHAISAAKNELLNPGDYMAQASGYFQELVGRAYSAYETELSSANALDFDDLLCKTVKLLQSADVVREYYQNRFKAIFIDEYQDTNRAQYLIATLLAAKHGNITVVGDDDQAVYSWRGADIKNILSFHKDYPQATVVTLEQNYRSTQRILDVAHAVIRQNTERTAKKLWTTDASGELVKLISVYNEQEEALTIVAEIERLIAEDGHTLSDMAVLYRTNAQSRAFEDAFLRRGFPYRLVGGTRFYERREIKDVLAYLRLMANPADEIAFSRIINVPKRKIGDKSLMQLMTVAQTRKLSLLAAIDVLDDDSEINNLALIALRKFRKLMNEVQKKALHLPLPQLIEMILQNSGYAEYIRDGTPEGEERWSNVSELVGLASEYIDIEPEVALVQFLENVALVSDVDSFDEDANGITLITLHQVKGLEFPVVFMAGLEEGLLPHTRSLENGEAGIEEERRLAYVGITRAKRKLYLLHAFRRHLYGGSKPAAPSRFLQDIPMELIEVLSMTSSGSSSSNQLLPRAQSVRQAIYARAIQPNPVEVAPQRFSLGMRVIHTKYGEGDILKSTMTRAGEEVVIRFDEAGIKIFAAQEAALRAVN